MKSASLLFFILFSFNSFAQKQEGPATATTGMQCIPGALPLKQHNLLLQRASYEAAPDNFKGARTTSGTGPVFDTSQWDHRVDSTWGVGWSDSEKLSVLNMFWGHVDSLYPCFVHLPAYNWDSIVTGMRCANHSRRK